jgi:hypothetical protein
VFFDRSGIRAMDDWEHRILRGLRSSKAMVALLSPAYFASEFCRREWKALLDHEHDRAMAGEGIAPVYLADVPRFELRGGADDDEWVVDLRQRQYSDLRSWREMGLL